MSEGRLSRFPPGGVRASWPCAGRGRGRLVCYERPVEGVEVAVGIDAERVDHLVGAGAERADAEDGCSGGERRTTRIETRAPLAVLNGRASRPHTTRQNVTVVSFRIADRYAAVRGCAQSGDRRPTGTTAFPTTNRFGGWAVWQVGENRICLRATRQALRSPGVRPARDTFR